MAYIHLTGLALYHADGSSPLTDVSINVTAKKDITKSWRKRALLIVHQKSFLSGMQQLSIHN